MKEKLLEFEKIFLSFTPEERNVIVNYLRKSAMNKLHEEIQCRAAHIEKLKNEILELEEEMTPLQVFP